MKPRDEATQVEDRFNAYRFWDDRFLTTYGLCPGAGKTPIAPLVINKIKPYMPPASHLVVDIESRPFFPDIPINLKEIWTRALIEAARPSKLHELFESIDKRRQLLLLCK